MGMTGLDAVGKTVWQAEKLCCSRKKIGESKSANFSQRQPALAVA